MLKSADAFCRSAVLYFIFIWLGLMVFIPNLLVLLASFLSKDPKYFLSLPLNLENYKALFDTVLFGVILKSLNIAFFTTVFALSSVTRSLTLSPEPPKNGVPCF